MNTDNSRSEETTSSNGSVEPLHSDARVVSTTPDTSRLIKKAHLTDQQKALAEVRLIAGKSFALYRDGRSAYLKTSDGRVHAITRDDPGLRQEIPRLFSILHTQKFYQHIVAQLEYVASTEGSPVTVRRLAYYDIHSKTSYLSRFDGQMVVCAPHQQPRVVPNGTDGVLFLDDPSWKPYSFPRSERRLGPKDLDEAIWGGIGFEEGTLSADEQRSLLFAFVLSTFFPELMPTRILLLMTGEKGSGKSFALRRIGRLVFGPDFDVTGVTGDLKDLDAVLTNQHFVAIDNVDSPVPQLLDRLAGAATGQVITKRRLFTTNESATYRMRAFLAITARTPHFQRDDIMDRVLALRLLRRKKNRPESELLYELDQNRDELMAWLVERIGAVVDTLANNPSVGSSELRMADFGAFIERAAPVLGLEKSKDVLARVQQSQEEFTVEGDPFLEVLDAWTQDPNNIGRALSLSRFRFELSELSRKLHLCATPALQNQLKFGHAISQQRRFLEDRYRAVITTGHAGARSITVWGDSPRGLPEVIEVPVGEDGEDSGVFSLPPPEDSSWN